MANFGRQVMQIPTDLVITTAFEELANRIDLFNQSQSAITIRSESMRGDLFEESLFKFLTNSGMSDRDTNSNDPVPAVALETFKQTWTKKNKRFGPIPLTKDQFKKTGLSENEVAAELGRIFAKGRIDGMIQSVMSALVGVTTKAAATIFDPSTTAVEKNFYGALNLMGDMQDKIELIVIHSFVFNIIQQRLATVATSTDMPFTQMVIGNGTIQRLAGKTFYVLDDSALVDTALTPDGHYTLFLPTGAAEVVESESVDFVIENVTGGENLVTQMQGENAYNINVKNTQFADAGIAGNVTDANLLTSSLWTDHNSSVKTGFGIVWISDDS